MEQFIIRGKKPLSGTLSVNGAKNHALKVIPAALLFEGPVTIHNVPMVEDVLRMFEIIRAIGGSVNVEGSTITVEAPKEFSGDLPLDIVPQLRASLVLLGPLLARYGRVYLPQPGGCNLGKRPMDFFLQFMEALGANIVEHEEAYEFTTPEGMKGTTFFFPLMSVTGTETMILAAARANGETVIKNAACEPEVVELAAWLRRCGLDISGEGTSEIRITGTQQLQVQDCHVIPDRIEAGSFAILAAATNSELTIDQCRPEHLELLLHTFAHMGIPVTTTEDSITVHPHGALKPQSVITHEYPGFPTDLQAPMTVLLTQAEGQSQMRETIYEGRLFYTDLLNSMGANIQLLDSFRAQIQGPTAFIGQHVMSPDIRAGIAMVIAGLMAEGETSIDHIYQIDRGYENIEERLRTIGADITRVEKHD